MSFSLPSIQSEIQRCAKSDTSGLEDLLTAYGPALFAYAQCGLDRAQSQQLVLDSFYLLWQHAGEYSAELGESLGWMLSIFRHLLRHQLQQTPADAAAHATAADIIPTLIGSLRADDAAGKLSAALSSCDDATLTVLCGRYFFAWDDAQCAKATGLGEAELNKKLDALYAYLTLYYQPWAIQEVDWQKLNARACIEALKPSHALASIHNRRNEEPAAARDTLRWEALFAELLAFLPATKLPADLYAGLQNRLGIKFQPATVAAPRPQPKESTQPIEAAANLNPETITPAQSDGLEPTTLALKRSLRRWRLFAVVNLLLIIGLAVLLLRPTEPPITVVQMAPRLGAVLQAPGHSATPGWVVSVDPQGQVLMTPQVRTELQADQRVQLWTKPSATEPMRSLGLIDPNAPVTLTTEHIGTVQAGQLFEMTLESSTGQSHTEPQGPVLFLGRVVSLGDYEDD